MGTTPLPGEIWGFQGGGQEEEGKDLRRLVDPKGSADWWEGVPCLRDGKHGLSHAWLDVELGRVAHNPLCWGWIVVGVRGSVL